MVILDVELFGGLPAHVINEIAQLAKEERYPAGQVVFREGDLAESLYILEHGHVAQPFRERSAPFPL